MKQGSEVWALWYVSDSGRPQDETPGPRGGAAETTLRVVTMVIIRGNQRLQVIWNHLWNQHGCTQGNNQNGGGVRLLHDVNPFFWIIPYKLHMNLSHACGAHKEMHDALYTPCESYILARLLYISLAAQISFIPFRMLLDYTSLNKVCLINWHCALLNTCRLLWEHFHYLPQALRGGDHETVDGWQKLESVTYRISMKFVITTAQATPVSHF